MVNQKESDRSINKRQKTSEEEGEPEPAKEPADEPWL